MRSGDTTALNIVPLSIMAVYRFDYLALRYKIPFVPYFKIGLAYYVWWIENGGGFLLDRAVHAARQHAPARAAGAARSAGS